MNHLAGKKLLVLGGSGTSLDILQYAKEMGVYTIVASNSFVEEVKKLADETVLIDTKDIDRLSDLIQDRGIHGILAGPSEFNLKRCIEISEKCGISFYATRQMWNQLQNKKNFKDLCRKWGVPHTKEYAPGEIGDPDFPVIVKPVDSCSARGVSVCYNSRELETAIKEALDYSEKKQFLIEKYVDNGGRTVSSRYIIHEGEAHLVVVGDRFVLKSGGENSVITWASQYPSQYSALYMDHIDEPVKKMFRGIGLQNGCLFMEAVPTADDRILFYEMGYRVSGGFTYRITDETSGVNEQKMLIQYILTGEMGSEEEIRKIDPYLNSNHVCNLSIPVSTGTIDEITGLEKIRELPGVRFIKQYLSKGDEVVSKNLGTLDQLFARIIIIGKEKKNVIKCINEINEILSIRDTDNREMYVDRFDPGVL